METAQLCLIITLCLLVHRSSSDILRRQKRNWIIDSFSIDEGYKGPFPYVLGRVHVESSLTVFRIEGQGVNVEPIDTLEIDKHTGVIRVRRPVDYEKYKVLKPKFQAINSTNQEIDTRLGIEILVKDANDNPPKFEHNLLTVSIKESTEQGTEIITFKATDADSEENSKFDFRIASVTPEPHDLEFILTNIQGQTGSLAFNGCLDHEKAEKYTVIVEAKDRGKDVQLSSSCTIVVNIEDGNNHMPVIVGQTYSGKVKERETNVLVTRLQVKDEDTVGTPAWKAVYSIHGDTKNNFNITTDPATNDGLLKVIKPIDFEESPMKNLTITVKNEIPYRLCKVLRRSSSSFSSSSSSSFSSSWQLEITTGVRAGMTGAVAIGGTLILSQSTRKVSVTVIDVNDPPSFEESNKQVKMDENQGAGQELATFTARDSDGAGANKVLYKVGHDPAGWVQVDATTGKVMTAKSLDRESPYVKDNTYVITVIAFDNGDPQMTSTATLSIYITDENDNNPVLAKRVFDMCQTNKTSMVNITVSDQDEDPYSGPFHFKLHGDVKNMWRVEPDHGYSVNLVKESSVYSGEFELLLEVSDRQHKTTVHNVSVTVCTCLDPTRPNCRFSTKTTPGTGAGVLIPIFFSLLLFAVAFLLLLWMSCKEEKIICPINEDSGQRLIQSHTEAPGEDCKVPYDRLLTGGIKTVKTIKDTSQVSTLVQTDSIGLKSVVNGHTQWSNSNQGSGVKWITVDNTNTTNQVMQEQDRQFSRGCLYRASGASASSAMSLGHLGRNSMGKCWVSARGGCSGESVTAEASLQQTLTTALDMMWQKRRAEEAELSDDTLRIYATEEDRETRSELSMGDIPTEPDLKLDLHQDQHVKFSTLASICVPSESAAYSAKTSCAEKREWKAENYHWHKTQDFNQTSDFKYDQVHRTYRVGF